MVATSRVQMLAGATLLLGSSGLALVVVGEGSAPPAPFAVATVRFEQNVTDGDVEVVFEAKGGDDGLARLTVVSPDGRSVVDATAPDPSTLGMRQFRFESPEPPDIARLKAAYPEGVYTFTGSTAAGATLHGTSRLSHTLAPPPALVRPRPGARGVSPRDLVITWTPGKNMGAYIVSVEQHRLGVELTTRLPGSATSFAVPNSFLVAGTKYQLGIGTVTREGNISWVETAFTTAGKE